MKSQLPRTVTAYNTGGGAKGLFWPPSLEKATRQETHSYSLGKPFPSLYVQFLCLQNEGTGPDESILPSSSNNKIPHPWITSHFSP